MKILCFEIKYVGKIFALPEWKQLAKEGRKIAAIKSFQIEKNKHIPYEDPKRIYLKEAKIIVEDYMNKKNIASI